MPLRAGGRQPGERHATERGGHTPASATNPCRALLSQQDMEPFIKWLEEAEEEEDDDEE